MDSKQDKMVQLKAQWLNYHNVWEDITLAIRPEEADQIANSLKQYNSLKSPMVPMYQFAKTAFSGLYRVEGKPFEGPNPYWKDSL